MCSVVSGCLLLALGRGIRCRVILRCVLLQPFLLSYQKQSLSVFRSLPCANPLPVILTSSSQTALPLLPPPPPPSLTLLESARLTCNVLPSIAFRCILSSASSALSGVEKVIKPNPLLRLPAGVEVEGTEMETMSPKGWK